MFNGLFQPTHLILILVVVLIIFGPGKLPEAGKALGNALRDMRNAFAGSDEDEQAAKGRKKNSGGEQVVASKVSENTHIN
ncbi:twin-arginine translocase TatA/TatE family subunit [Desulfallas sp. Bu1-1]|jgi:sec-independent protein translocase protein TatA|uniref:twin-arginine translocase TatA/TatE family subunit n=1 Tax=Desulfallas sp. Bu1-1 TaxID=2787620 RepID=UPI0018A05A33|nr:twin-arginine translocase TatA/TatE family subunit [Desulfallas sp. Bu1-1]MBF7082980.1 twin-arginine translocase TatA/TatE family subunit [Desulfallas sp. Bu1-1]